MMRLVNCRLAQVPTPTISRANSWSSRSCGSKIDNIFNQTPLANPLNISTTQRKITTGHATPEDTKGYFRRLKNEGVQLTPEMNGWCSGTGFTTSRVGYGGYRINISEFQHRDSLGYALENGCNIVDTSSNYTQGESEALIGDCIAILEALNKIKREEVVVVTKGGYIQDDISDEVDKRLADGRPYMHVVEISPILRHCIGADFIRDQLNSSLKRMRLGTIDAYLLHNPEYYFKVHEGKVKAGTMQHKKIQDDFYHIIKETFEALEEEVKKGRIQYYGVSSNAFVTPKDHFSHVSLERMLDIAQWVNDRHHFKVIEFPMNIVEPEALINVNNDGQTLLDFASRRGFMTLANRPLNADHPRAGGLVRLVDSSPAHKEKDLLGLLSEAFNVTVGIEKSYPGLLKPDDPFLPNYKKVSWAQILASNSEQFTDPSLWASTRAVQIQPALDQVLTELSINRQTRSWAVQYRAAMRSLLERFQWMVEANHSAQIRQLNKFVNNRFPIMKQAEYKFSDKAVDLILNTKVDVVLMGMRRKQYAMDFFPAHPFPAMPRERVTEGLKQLYDFLRTNPNESKEENKKEPDTKKV